MPSIGWLGSAFACYRAGAGRVPVPTSAQEDVGRVTSWLRAKRHHVGGKVNVPGEFGVVDHGPSETGAAGFVLVP